MKFLTKGNWGLKLLALILALVIYYTMKPEGNRHDTYSNDRLEQEQTN